MAKKFQNPTDDDISRVMRALGSRGAKAGHAKLTPSQRKERARELAKARWDKGKAS